MDIREGVEDEDVDGVDVAGMAVEGREDDDVNAEVVSEIAEIETRSVVPSRP